MSRDEGHAIGGVERSWSRYAEPDARWRRVSVGSTPDECPVRSRRRHADRGDDSHAPWLRRAETDASAADGPAPNRGSTGPPKGGHHAVREPQPRYCSSRQIETTSCPQAARARRWSTARSAAVCAWASARVDRRRHAPRGVDWVQMLDEQNLGRHRKRWSVAARSARRAVALAWWHAE
jgi:hypothetical protein